MYNCLARDTGTTSSYKGSKEELEWVWY